MMGQIDVYGDDALHTLVNICVLPPLNDYYGSSLCAGCHYTSDLSILLAKQKKNNHILLCHLSPQNCALTG